jgi:hypothetical protein
MGSSTVDASLLARVLEVAHARVERMLARAPLSFGAARERREPEFRGA